MGHLLHTELLIAPDGDVYARLLYNDKTIKEKLVRRRSRSKQEAIDEGWEVANGFFEAEIERRRQLPLFGPRVIWRHSQQKTRKAAEVKP